MANLECTPDHNDYNLVNVRTRYLIFVSMLNYIMFLNTQCTFLVFSSGRLPVRVPWSIHQVDSACWYLVEPWGVLFWVCLVLWSIKLTINEVIIDQLVCSFESFVIFTRDLFFWYSASLLSFFSSEKWICLPQFHFWNNVVQIVVSVISQKYSSYAHVWMCMVIKSWTSMGLGTDMG